MSTVKFEQANLDLKEQALAVAAEGITIADARLPDMPIIYVNKGFEKITGYSSDEALGTNCRFLQGSDTDPSAAMEIRAAIAEQRECLVEILNYRKDGSTFWNRLSITPIRDDNGVVTHFIGVQSDITIRRLAEEALEQTNRRLLQSLEAAAHIQRSLLPHKLPDLKGLTAAWAFRPCTELAGDTLNIIPLDHEHIGFYILDVSGHGVPASLLSVTLSHTLTGKSSQSFLFTSNPESETPVEITPPAEIAHRLNHQFQMDPSQRMQYFTMFYGIVNTTTLKIQYVSAGHPPAIVMDREGVSRLLDARGYPIGLLKDARFEQRETQLNQGDRLFLYTDGVIEATSEQGEELGSQRLRHMLRNTVGQALTASVESVKQQVLEWCNPNEPEDDVSILTLEMQG